MSLCRPHPNPIIAEDIARLLELSPGLLTPLGGRTLLITGAQGFLLSYAADLVAAFNAVSGQPPCRLILVDNLLSGNATRLTHLRDRNDVVWLDHDVSRPLSIDGPVDYVIHGASIASPMVYRQYPLETIAANVDGTRHLLELARSKNAAGVIVMSSSEIYGDPEPSAIPTPETYRGSVSCTGPRACYDESKRLAETVATTYHRLYGLPVKIIRPFNVYGPGQRLDDQRVFPDFLRAALSGGPIIMFSDGLATRSFCYVADAIDAIFRVLLTAPSGEAYNVGNDEVELSMRALADHFVDVTGGAISVEYRNSADKDYTTDNPQRRCPDLTKLRTACGWAPQIGIQEGIRRCLESYRAQP